MQVIGKRIYHFNEVASTNDVLKSPAMQSQGEGVVVVADSQTVGRGRHGKKWYSPKGIGLYLSVFLTPDLSVEYAGLLSLFPAIAVARAIAQHVQIQAKLKWPNDILLCGKKVAGVLVEVQSRHKSVHHAIAGVGVNLDHGTDDFPAHFRRKAGSIFSCTNKKVTRENLLKSILANMDSIYTLPGDEKSWRAHIIEEWMKLCAHRDHEVILETKTSAITGVFIGLSGSGDALIKRDMKNTLKINDGHLVIGKKYVTGH